MPVLLGAIADDFTGATDLANTLVRQGMRAVQTIGVPDEDFALPEADAVVVALKSRTIVPEEAIAQSLEALAWLRARGARQFLFKYCSTFDSTDEGNIGPVADALLEALGETFTIACPAFPAAGRTIYKGHLFVGDVLLSESGMRNHPLTPMRDANLVRVLSRQTPHAVGLVPFPAVDAGPQAVRSSFEALRGKGVRHAIVDALTEEHLMSIGAACADLKLITGGSGIALGLPENFRSAGLLEKGVTPALPAARGRAVVLAGSCSEATLAQVAHAKAIWPARLIDPLSITDVEQEVADCVAWALAQDEAVPVLLYSSQEPSVIRSVQERLGRSEAGDLVERVHAGVAAQLVGAGAGRLIVAGGETSGAVVQALGVKALEIGPEIDPGVPWTRTLGAQEIALALKSGNFGSGEFFEKALGMLA
ncbi:MAG: four-carbon acid sugar kinase family protein [Alphaproteobacteria bacterium]|nr:MAG: four-carbon acid sugar kinase family protein [Alphaproteobacteria bacterium]